MPERPLPYRNPAPSRFLGSREGEGERPSRYFSVAVSRNERDRDTAGCYGWVMCTPRSLGRAWSATGITSWSDMNGRLRAMVEAGISPKGAGRHTRRANEDDASGTVLAVLAGRLWKDVPDGIRRYGSLMASGVGFTEDFPSRFGEDTCRDLQARFENQTLLQVLAYCLRTFHSGSKPEIRFLSLNIERSEYQAKASLYLGDPPTEFAVHFREDPREGSQVDPIVESVRMRGFALTAMADLLADNLRTTHENGPSVSADEPLPPDEKTPRGANPETTRSQPEARRERDKSQVGFESYGETSGGAPLPPTEPPDEDRPKRYG
jgi:hypothetical protein